MRIFRRIRLGFVLPTLSLIVYASTVFSLPQIRDARYCCEQSSFAAAVSHLVYKAPLGSLYSGVFDFFIAHFDDPLGPTLVAVRELPSAPPGAWQPTTLDGNGIGYPLIASAAFRLFGLRGWAPSALMLMLMAVSAAAFMARFSEAYRGIVSLYFSALTVMLFTSLVWDPWWSTQIPVGGIRYFSLVGALPIFHILLSLLDGRHPRAGSAIKDFSLLAIQTLILIIAVLVRGSALSLIGALVLVCVIRLWRDRHDPARYGPLLRDLAIMGGVSLALLAVIVASVPRQYLTEGRFSTVFWQRVTESVGLNPAWPFPGADDIFRCKKYVPQGLEAGPSDNNGMCIWFDYVIRHNIPIDSLGDKSFGKLYEIAMRDAFFTIARHYPGEVLKTFLYYKPPYIPWSIAETLRFNFTGDQARAVRSEGRREVPYSAHSVALLAASLTLVLVYFIWVPVGMSEIRKLIGAALLSAVFTTPAYFAAWAMPHTSADLVLYVLCAAGLALGTLVLSVRAVVRRLAPSATV